jgi:hypothetical protein
VNDHERKLIIRLDGQDLDAGVSVLVVHQIEGKVEVVVTEQHGSDSVVVLSREQVQSLARALTVALDA